MDGDKKITGVGEASRAGRCAIALSQMMSGDPGRWRGMTADDFESFIASLEAYQIALKECQTSLAFLSPREAARLLDELTRLQASPN